MKENQLLELIKHNARLSTSDLASALRESEENVLQTLNALQQEKIICGYHTVINWDKTNKEQVMSIIQVSVTPEREYGYDRIAKKIYRYEEVDTMYLMSGASEFIVIIYGKTMQEIAKFVGSKLACIDSVTGTSTLFVLKKYKSNGVILEEKEDVKERLVVTP